MFGREEVPPRACPLLSGVLPAESGNWCCGGAEAVHVRGAGPLGGGGVVTDGV